MTWKQAKYTNHQNYIIFQVIPMHKGKDIIVIPNKEQWGSVQNVFSFSEREEILFLIEHIKWKREEKYALSCKGNVLIKKELLVEGSVVNELCIPILQENSNVKIQIV